MFDRMPAFAGMTLLFMFVFLFSAPAFASCSSPAGDQGKTIYNSVQKIMQYCDGTNWIAMNTAGSGSGGCASPAGAEGKIIYNTDYHVMQVCSGTQWMAMGPVGDAAIGVSTAGLVGHWKLDDGAGATAADSSGNGNNGTLNGGTWTTGVDNGALSLNGTSDYVSTVSAPDLAGTDHVTFSAWVKNSSTVPATTEPVVYKKNPQFTLAISGSGRIVSEINNDGGWHWTTPSSTAYSDWDQWHHVAAVYDGSTVTYYRDGVQEGTAGSETGNITGSSTAGIFIGRSSGGGVYWNGEIDDVRIYNRALSVTEIQNLYDASSMNAGLVGHWKLDDGAGTTATDSSGNGNDGTLTNMDPATDWVPGIKSGALDFDGVNDYVNVGTMDIDAAATISAWVNINPEEVNGAAILGKNFNTFQFYYDDSTGKLMFQTNAGAGCNGQSTGTVTEDEWVHVALTWDTITGATFFINGASSGTLGGSCLNEIANNGALFVSIGVTSFATSRFLHGQVDDVRLYDRSLSATEIQKLYGCTAPAYVEGSLHYNPSWTVMQYCNGINWVSVGKQPQADCPNVGDLCADGSYYAGLSPDGNVPMYMADASTESSLTWDDGNNNSTISGATSLTDGDGNTATLIVTDSNSVAAGVQPHNAAAYCDGLTAHGHNDWYLPAYNEAVLIYNGGSQIGDINLIVYWTSKEQSASLAANINMSTGGTVALNKANSRAVRCVRHY